jgi:hypothetical protein
MIPYVEIIKEYEDGTLRTFAYIEPIECWFELSYQDVGEFEIYCSATRNNLKALKKGYFVKIPNRRFGWIITSVQYNFNAESGAKTISAKGYELKWLLKKRINTMKMIYGPKTICSLVRSLVSSNITKNAYNENRRIPYFSVTGSSSGAEIPQMQLERANLLEYVNTLLKAYSCGSTAYFKGEGNTHEILFYPYEGKEKQNTVRFSQSYDNLLSSSYYSTNEDVGTYAYVVSEAEITKIVSGEEIKQEIEVLKEVGDGKGSERSEILIENNLSTKYEDENGNEKELDLTNKTDLKTFNGWQEEEAKKELALHTLIEQVDGEIDLNNSLYKFDEDFFLGDKVRVQEEHFDFFFDAIVSKFTIKQDSSGYGEEIEYNE